MHSSRAACGQSRGQGKLQEGAYVSCLGLQVGHCMGRISRGLTDFGGSLSRSAACWCWQHPARLALVSGQAQQIFFLGFSGSACRGSSEQQQGSRKPHAGGRDLHSNPRPVVTPPSQRTQLPACAPQPMRCTAPSCSRTAGSTRSCSGSQPAEGRRTRAAAVAAEGNGVCARLTAAIQEPEVQPIGGRAGRGDKPCERRQLGCLGSEG